MTKNGNAITTKLRTATSENQHAWPDRQIQVLKEEGCFAQVVPTRFGGQSLSPRQIAAAYESVARESLTAALVLTQHDRACELIAESDNLEPARHILPLVAEGKALTTVGISQLTTSHRGKEPAMRAEVGNGMFIFDGVMPWVSSASKADYIVTGAVLSDVTGTGRPDVAEAGLSDQQQILACIPTDAPGLTIEKPMNLLALTSSLTSEVCCERIPVSPKWILRGPMPQVLAQRAPVKPLTVSSVGIGFAASLLDAIEEYSANLQEFNDLVEKKIREPLEQLRAKVYTAAHIAGDASEEETPIDIRAEVNTLIQQQAMTLMTLIKGSGYLDSHPMQRLIREALFFLVWSAPDPVRLATLQRIWQ